MTLKNIFKLALFSLLLNSSAVFAADNSAVLGKWTLDMSVQGQQVLVNLTIAEDGSLVEDGLLPGFIQWPGGRNPANKLPDSGITLARLILQHPKPDAIGKIIEQLGIDGPVEVRSGPTNLIFELNTRAGDLVSLASATQ